MTDKVIIIYPEDSIGIISHLPPIGPLQIVSYLRQKEVDASFYDFSPINNRLKILNEIINEKPCYIGLSSNVANYSNTIFYAKKIKQIDSNIRIIVGGPLPSSAPEEYLKYPFIDAVCKGEGEISSYEYLIRGNNARGIVTQKNKLLIYNETPPLIEDLDTLPFPAFDQINFKNYHFSFQKKKPISNILSSRGCPYHCGFCFHGVSGYKWRPRSPKNVIKEILWQHDTFGIKELCISDDNFTLDLKRTNEICDLLKKEKIDLIWQCSNGIRSDRINFKTLYNMKQAGCWNISLAPESGDPVVLNKIQKGFDLNQVLLVAKWARKLKIFTTAFFIVGLPYETPESGLKTLNYIQKLNVDFLSMHVYTPFPNTPIAEEFKLKPSFNRSYWSKTENHELNDVFRKANINFYSNPRKFLNILNKIGFRFTFETGIYYLKAIIKDL